MHLKAFIISLMAIVVCAHSHIHERRHQQAQPASDIEKPKFGEQTQPTGIGIDHCSNYGNPYGSNILLIDEVWASSFKYIAKFYSPATTTESWNIVIWNSCGKDGKIGGWVGQWAQNFQIAPGETKYVAFDEDSNGAWGAAPGNSPVLDASGSCASTWGEFIFGGKNIFETSSFNISSARAQDAGLPIQGMQICSVQSKDYTSISSSGEFKSSAVSHAGHPKEPELNAGPVTLEVTINFSG